MPEADLKISVQAADILRGQCIGSDDFTLGIYPASAPIYKELAERADCGSDGNRSYGEDGVLRTMFRCAGDTPANEGSFDPSFHT